MWLLFEPCRSKRQPGRAHREQETNFGGALLHKPGSLSLAFLVVAAVVFSLGPFWSSDRKSAWSPRQSWRCLVRCAA